MKYLPTFIFSIALMGTPDTTAQASFISSEEAFNKLLGQDIGEIFDTARQKSLERMGITAEELAEMQEDKGKWTDGQDFVKKASDLAEPFDVIKLAIPKSSSDAHIAEARRTNTQMIDGIAEHVDASEEETTAAKSALEIFLNPMGGNSTS